MKFIPRSGWISHHVRLSDVESVAEHSFLATTIAMLLADEARKVPGELDVEKVLRLATLHDISEALTFDISHQYLDYLGKKGNRVKTHLEVNARKRILSWLRPEIARKYGRLLREYSDGKTLEARIVHAADGLDILLQAIAYLRKGYPDRSLRPIWESTINRVRAQRIRAADRMVAELEAERRRLLRD